mgnify:CR=1 FL=1
MQDAALQYSMMRSFRRDSDVKADKLAPGTVRRIARFAAPYKKDLAVFLSLIVVAAFVTVLNPLIFKKIIDDGIGTNPPLTGDRALVVELALLVARYCRQWSTAWASCPAASRAIPALS